MVPNLLLSAARPRWDGDQQYGRWGRPTCGSGGRMSGSMLVKAIIVVIAFPMFTHAIYMASTFLLGFLLPQILERMGDWSDVVHRTVVVGTIAMAAHSSFRLCRRIWPTPKV